MGYRLGIDLGTTWTAAAVARDDGGVAIVGLGSRSTAIPTLVHVGADGEVAVGEVAARRGSTSPDGLAREVKRRIGDTVPILLGGRPHAPEALLVEVAAWVVATVTALEGGPPDAVRVTHPANWGPLRRELLEGALRARGIGPLSLVTEPEAAAAHYAGAERVPIGTTVAVYDLGGGTFDATVLRKEAAGFAVLGRPDGVDRLGGLDFDAAVVEHVVRSLGPAWAALDPDDPAVHAGVARLREACVLAKEALSADADAAVSVTIPGLVTEVRITRGELEEMIRPALLSSVEALRRAVDGAGLALPEIDRILLVGGSSRIPLVTELVGALGRPVTSDAHPKHAVALGAAAGAGSPPLPPETASDAAGAVPPAPGPATATPTVPTGTGARRPLLALAAALVVLAVAVAGVALLGGDDDDGGALDAATSTSAEPAATTTTLGPADLEGSYALDLELDGCQPAGATCFEAGEVGFEVRCLEDRCTAAFGGLEASEPAAPATGGAIRFAGSGSPDGLLPCEVQADPGWTLLVTPAAGPDGTVSALAGELTITAATGCDATSASYALTGRPGEPGDQVAELAGTWTLVDDLPSCTGDGCSFGTLAMTLVVDCVGAVCTATLGGSEPVALVSADVIAQTGLLRQASGTLPAGAGLTCGGDDVTTAFGLSLEPQLDGQGRLAGTVQLSTAPDGPCPDATYQAEFVGLPA